MQFGKVQGLIIVQEGDHQGIYICHHDDPKHEGEPSSFTKIGAYHDNNRTLVLGNSSEHSVLKQAATGKLPVDAVQQEKVNLLIHFDAEAQDRAERAARRAARAAAPPEPLNLDEEDDEADNKAELTAEEQAAADEADLRGSIDQATKKQQLLDIAAEHNVKIADPEAKMDELRAELLAGIYPAPVQEQKPEQQA